MDTDTSFISHMCFFPLLYFLPLKPAVGASWYAFASELVWSVAWVVKKWNLKSLQTWQEEDYPQQKKISEAMSPQMCIAPTKYGMFSTKSPNSPWGKMFLHDHATLSQIWCFLLSVKSRTIHNSQAISHVLLLSFTEMKIWASPKIQTTK